ncbi:MAG: SDR family oxidoreductase [Clostridiales Family XIII bacterium]|jgi:UDP-glucuronate decarboxylase|nr:SDR family oxidoreductase [Clostridiales Family XIII bacterium]
MKRILVTGGAGFIGSHLCERLLEAGHEVICADNLHTGSKRNIKALMRNDRFEFLRHDITQTPHVEADLIYNLACPASPAHYMRDPVRTLATNVTGAMNALELARRAGARILQASTSEVYGDPLEHPQREAYRGNVNPTGPRACYDEGKRAAETLFFDYKRRYGVEIKVMRIFNTYGPNMHADDGRVVSNFIVQALKGADVTVYGDGTQTRSFCHVDDLVEGMLRLMESPADFTGPVNMGNPEEFTVLELAKRIVELTGSRSRIVFSPLPEDDPKRRRPDIGLAKEALGWTPKVRLEEGLGGTIAYFKALLKED